MKVENKNLLPRCGQGIILILLTVFLFFYLQATQEYSYFYREQNQLLQWDPELLTKMILPIGGFTKFLAETIVQFYILPKMGALLTTLLSLISAHFIWNGLKHICRSWWLTPLAFIPALVYNIYLLDNYAQYEGMVALVMLSFCFWLHTALGNINYYAHLAITTIVALILFYLAGSVAIPFGIAVFLYEAVTRTKKCYYFLLPLVLVGLAALLAVNQALIPTFGQAYWIAGYVEYYFEPTTLYSMSWISLFVLILFFKLLGKLKSMNFIVESAAAVLLGIILCFGYRIMTNKHQDVNMYNMERVIYLAKTEQWDALINLPYDEANNLIIMNYQNLALSEKGELLDKLFTITQTNKSQSLFMDYQQYTDIGVMRAKTYYQMGAIAASQMMAVSANMSISNGCPDMVKLIVKNYLITGKFTVAEKYIRQLENTWYYADWAKQMKTYLNNDKAINADPELGFKRKDLPKNNEYFTIYAGILNDALTVLEANPKETPALDYAIGYLLLEKNFNYIKPFVEYNYGKPWLKQLPVRLQEAVVTYSEHDMDYCRKYGVSEEIIQKWAEFRQEALNIRHNGGSNSQLAAQWGDTFWCYMMKGGN